MNVEQRSYDHKTATIFLRNAAIAATRHQAAPIEDPKRLACLKEYAMGIVEGLEPDVTEGYLSWQELTAALAAAALVIHSTRCARS